MLREELNRLIQLGRGDKIIPLLESLPPKLKLRPRIIRDAIQSRNGLLQKAVTEEARSARLSGIKPVRYIGQVGGNTEMSARQELDLIQLKAVDLGYTYDTAGYGCYPSSEKPNKKYFPTLYINDREDELGLPLSGVAKIKFRLKSKTTRQDENGKQRHSADIEVQSIDPIEEEANQPTSKLQGSAKSVQMSARNELIQFAIKIDPKNEGKFTATKKRTGKTDEELKRSKNPLTRKRAVFAENAKHWNHSGKKEMSARETLNSIIGLAADPRPRNTLGMFEDQIDGPNPNEMGITYKSGLAAAGVAAGAGGASAIKALMKRAAKKA